VLGPQQVETKIDPHRFLSGQLTLWNVLAHEIGKHVQRLVGTEPNVRSMQQRSPGQA
jgi:predicted metalloprotease